MPTVQVQAQLSADDLLHAVEQLEAAQLNEFVAEVLALRARRHGSCLSRSEAEWLGRINASLPPPLQGRYDELTGKRQAETLTPEEHAELLRLTDEVERLQAERAEALVELARLRGQPLAAVLKDLGIPAADG